MYCNKKYNYIIKVFIILLIFVFSDKAISQKIRLNITPGYILPINEVDKRYYSSGFFADAKAAYEVSNITDLYLFLTYQRFFLTDASYYESYNVYCLFYGIATKVFILNTKVRPYIGLELGAGYQYSNYESKSSSYSEKDGLGIIICPNIGFTYPINDKFFIEPNIKIFHGLGSMAVSNDLIEDLMFGIGITYQINNNFK